MSISDQHDADQDPHMMQIQIICIPIRIKIMPISDQHDGNPEKYDANADQHYEISDEHNADPQY